MIKHDVPALIDGVCKLMFQTQPEDPAASIAHYFTAQRLGLYHGGLVAAGIASSGGWLRIFNNSGAVTSSIDRIPLQLSSDHNEIQLVTGAPRENCVFFVSSPTAIDDRDGPSGTIVNSCVRKYDVATGQLVDTFETNKAISCITCHREKNHLWVFFKSGGCVVLQTSNGAQIREVANTPPTQAAAIRQNLLYLLTLKTIERRDLEGMQLEHVMHLPDSMMKPSTFVLNPRHLWCASANADGSANFIGIYDATGRPVSTFLPPPVPMIAVDQHRGGTWHLPRQYTSSSASGQLVFVNDRGNKVITCELGKFRKGNLVIDKGTGLVWIFRQDEDRCRVGLYHPYQQQYVAEVVVPDTLGPTAFLAAL